MSFNSVKIKILKITNVTDLPKFTFFILFVLNCLFYKYVSFGVVGKEIKIKVLRNPKIPINKKLL